MGSGQYVLQMRKGFAYTVCYSRKIAGWALSGARYAPTLGHHSHSSKQLCRQRKTQVLFIIRMAGSSTSVLLTMESLLSTAPPLLPTDTRCLKCSCWGQWSVDTPMDSVVSEEKFTTFEQMKWPKIPGVVASKVAHPAEAHSEF